MTTIRRATQADIPALQRFFTTAYGAATVFRDAEFLTWYLGGPGTLMNGYVALDERAEVVSHYGWLDARLSYRGNVYPHIWGVNAFTLPELRGGGIGREIVEHVRQVCPSFGVIGFSEKTADFYDSIGFNVFRKRRFDRHVLVLRDAVHEITRLVGTADQPRADALVPRTVPSAQPVSVADAWSDAPVDHLAAYCTPVRSTAWLDWRYSPRSLLPYRVLTHGSEERGRAIVAYRCITLVPTSHVMTRIVDIYGDPKAVAALVHQLCVEAQSQDHLYVELSSFSGPYAGILAELGFVTLTDDAYSILPSLTNPIGHRENNEYVGLLAQPWSTLEAESAYFTLADSDRDRRGRLES